MKKVLIALAAMMFLSVACVSQSSSDSSIVLPAADVDAGGPSSFKGGDTYLPPVDSHTLNLSDTVSLLNGNALEFFETEIPVSPLNMTSSSASQEDYIVLTALRLKAGKEVTEEMSSILELVALKQFLDGYPDWETGSVQRVEHRDSQLSGNKFLI